MFHAAVDFGIWVSRPFGAEFPDRPVGAVLVVEELYELRERVAIRELGVGTAGAGGRDDWGTLEDWVRFGEGLCRGDNILLSVT